MEQSGEQLFYDDICETFSPRELTLEEQITQSMTQGQGSIGSKSGKPCRRSPIPIDFVYDDVTNSFSIDKFDSDADLLAQIQRGRTKSDLYRN